MILNKLFLEISDKLNGKTEDSSFYHCESTTISFIRGKRTMQKRAWNKDSNCTHFIGKGPQKS